MKISRLLSLLIVALLLPAACTVKVYKKHPSLQDIGEDTPTATVYFIRPELIKPKGYADKPLRVDFNGQQIINIAQGRYTMIRIKPSQGYVVTHSMTKFTNQLKPINVSRKHFFNFQAGITYFIYLKQLNEEFRGVFYYPTPVSLAEAKKIIIDAKPSGVPRNAYIHKLTHVQEAPEDNVVDPAFPEQLYKQTPYLLKKPTRQ